MWKMGILKPPLLRHYYGNPVKNLVCVVTKPPELDDINIL